MIHYFTSDDLPGATASFVDEDASWWVGVQNCGAQLALAAALTLSASTAAIATQVFSFHQDDPALTASYQDEQSWNNQVVPYVAPTIIPNPWDADEQIPPLTAGYLDEQAWQNPIAPVPYWPPPQVLSDDQFIVPLAAQGIPDDNELWQNQVAPYVAPTVVPSSAIDEQTPALTAGYLEEQSWQNLVVPMPYWIPPQVFLDDQVFVRQSLTIFVPWIAEDDA